MPVLFPTPRQGFILTIPVKNPWGESTDTGIDISPMVHTAPGSWHQVIQAWEGSTYLANSFIYVARTAGEMVVMADRTIGLIHESQIKMTLPRDSFKPEYDTASTEEYMAAFKEAAEKKNRPGILAPANGRHLEV